ncbi:uncharacterized protein LOC130589900 [Beta vulgaris subsp. vulgaris]|uniref:uncharacterized protein LOC130589900 n=1 Tax=Beta vulgaris subsp. vulgaris TaxID=3555 RepID=UPI002546FB9D|nr:uncharacterized protein LOC130589900 [Beta vulgaris subsp. vulgaris]
MALIAAQLQQTLQQSLMQMLTTLQQDKQRSAAQEPGQSQRAPSRQDEHPPPGERSAHRETALRREETHVSRSPRGNPGRKPEDARNILNEKRRSQGYDARQFLDRKAAQREGQGDSAQSKPLRLGNESLKFMTPFSREIIDTPTQGKVKTPLIEQFAGLTDPEDHMATYKAQMSVQTSCEATWCRFFPTTLKGLALNWFQELPAGIITDFAVLEDMFTHQFVAGKRQKKTSLHLMRVKQEKNESLADYIKRFNEESLKVSDLQDAVAFAALMSGLQPGRLRWTLAESEVKTFSEAMAKAQRFIQAADVCRHSEEGSKKRKEEGSNRDQPKQQKTGGRSDRFTTWKRPSFQQRTERNLLESSISPCCLIPHPSGPQPIGGTKASGVNTTENVVIP